MDLQRMEPNATYRGIEGIFIPLDRTTTTTTRKTTTTTTRKPTTTTTTTKKPTTTTTTTTKPTTTTTTTTKKLKAVAPTTTPATTTTTTPATTTTVELEPVVLHKEVNTNASTATSTAGTTTTIELASTDSRERVKASSSAKNNTVQKQESGGSSGFFGKLLGPNATTTTSTSGTTAADKSKTRRSTVTSTTATSTTATTSTTTVELDSSVKEVKSKNTTSFVVKDSKSPGPGAAKSQSTTAAPKSTTRVDLDRSDTSSDEVLKKVGIMFSNIPKQSSEPRVLDLASQRNRVQMYQNEPCVVGVYARPDSKSEQVFLELADPEHSKLVTNTTGATSSEAWMVITPRGEVGEVQSLNLTLVGTDRHVYGAYDMEVEIVRSMNSRLSQLKLRPGRLDPVFKPRTTDYYMRIPAGTSRVKLEFKTWNDVDGKCYVEDVGREGSGHYFVGGGKLSVDVPKGCPDCPPLIFNCYNDDQSSQTQYVLNFVPQLGGETLLKSVDVLGADLNQNFEPEKKGVYYADLIRGAQKDRGDVMEWTQIRAVPFNDRAIVKVDGERVDVDHLSPYIRVPRGQSKLVEISVTTPENSIAEVYEVSVSRDTGDRSVWATDRGTREMGNWLGLLSSALSLPTAGRYLSNARALQVMSTYGHSFDVPELYDAFSDGFHPYAFQPNLNDYQNQSVVLHGSPVVEPLPEMAGVDPSNSTSKLKTSLTYLTSDHLSAMAPASIFKLADASYASLAESVRQDFERSSINFEAVQASLTNVDGRWVLNEMQPHRQLTAISPEDRINLSRALESRYKNEENLRYYSTALTVGLGALSTLLLIYGLVYTVYLKEDPSATRTKKVSEDQKSLPSELRRDYPAFLHPARFLTFIMDLAFIGMTGSAFGFLFADKTGINSVSIFGIHFGILHLQILAAVVIIGAIAYLGFGALTLNQISGSLVYGKEFCEYHDSVLTHAKGTYVPKWCRHIPILNRMFTVEISGAVPLKSAKDLKSNSVRFHGAEGGKTAEGEYDERQSLTGGDLEGQEPYGENTEQASLEYNWCPEKKAIEVAVNDLVFNDETTSYDNRNAELYSKYPDANLGETQFIMRNSYGYPVTLHGTVKIQHMTTLMQLIDQIIFWLPRKNAQLPAADAWKNLMINAGRGLLYDWVIDRAMLFATLAAAAFLNKKGTVTATIVVTLFSFLSAFCKLPAVLGNAQSKHNRDMATAMRLDADLEQAKEQAAAAEQIWPFNQPGLTDRFYELRQKKAASEFFGLGGIISQIKGDPIQRLRYGEQSNQAMVRPLGVYYASEVVCSTAFGDLMLGLLGALLIVNRRSSGQASAFGTVIVCAVGLLCLNFRSMAGWSKQVCQSVNELLHESVLAMSEVWTALFGIDGIGARLSYFFAQCGKWITRDPTCNFTYPKAGVYVARFPVDEVDIVSNELGMMINTRVGTGSPYHELSVPDRNRLRVYKTLVVNGGLGADRHRIYRSLPMQVPFLKLFKDENENTIRLNDDTALDRLCATIQVVNHTTRANAAGLAAVKTDEHDSFLSLYARDEYFPSPGKVRLRKDCHTYSVRFNPEQNQLIVRGPAIAAGHQYTLKTLKNQPDRKSQYVNAINPAEPVSDDASMVSPSAAKGVAQALCDTVGAIRLHVTPDLAPNLYKEMIVETPTGAQYVIDPNVIKIHYDQDCNEIFIRFQELHPNPQPYRFTWTVSNSANMQPINVAAVAEDNGCIVFTLPDDQAADPDLKSWMALRDEQGAVIDIDPRETDAYQFWFPEQNTSLFKTIFGRLATALSFVTGGDTQTTAMEEPIPCTVVQCVNPVERIYRVDPNFHESHRVMNARIHELRARQVACESSDDISMLWQSLMKSSEYVDFWKKQGVTIVDEQGNLVDPLQNPDQVPLFHGQFKEIAVGEANLRRELSYRLEERIRDVQGQMDTVRLWIRAYTDPSLHTTQLAKDLGEWSTGVDENISRQLQAQKEVYGSTIPNFVYPCNIPDVLISKRPNMSAQFRVWTATMQSWLLFEEGVDLSDAESKMRVANIVREVMQSLKVCLQSNESFTRNSYRSALHYVIGSQKLRGLRTEWKPDSFKAHTALVRIWHDAGEGSEVFGQADFSRYPEWMPCLLRLTPNLLQILLPNQGDLTHLDDEVDAFPWQRSTGLYIPLTAFSKFELTDNDPNPPNEDNNPLLEFMTSRLTCRKDQRSNIPDNYARRMEDDVLGNEICFYDNASGGHKMRYRVMLGHCVSRSDLKNYPQDEIDLTIPTNGDESINVYPLSFRFSPHFAEQWKRAIATAKLCSPHNQIFTEPPPKEFIPPQEDTDTTPSESSTPRAETPPAPPTPPREPTPPPPPTPEPPTPPARLPTPPPPTPPPVEEEKTDTVSQTETVSSNQEAITLYIGHVDNSQFHGPGAIRDEAGRAVFEGAFKSNKREGEGKTAFSDKNGIQWMYQGYFMDDEMAGEGVVTLADPTQVASAEDRYTLISYTGKFMPLQKHEQVEPLSASEMGELTQNNLKKRTAFVAERSDLPKDQAIKVENLVNSVYTRMEGESVRIMADRFAMNDVVMDKELLEKARRSKSAQCKFLQTFLPHLVKWRDSTCLDRAAEDGTWRYVDGSVFQGRVGPDYKPMGRGSYFHWPTGTKYEGEMVNGVPHGQGVIEGEIKGRKYVYRGNWENGERVGPGALELGHQDAVVNGIWNKNTLGSSSGLIDIKLSEEFLREFDMSFTKLRCALNDNGNPHGQIRSEMMDGTVFEGSVEDGKRNGWGKWTSPAGDVLFEGEFKNDMPDGRCSQYLLPDGKHLYCGNMMNGWRHGSGQLVDKNTMKVVYEGMWRNDVPHGRGICRMSDGEYEGEFVEGRRHGKGRFVFKEAPLPNGKQRYYEGDWQNDLPHGLGKYLSDDGVENVYRMNKGVIVEASVKEYKPTCGKAPEMKTKPTVRPTELSKKVDFRQVVWTELQPDGTQRSRLPNILAVVTDPKYSWKGTPEQSTVFIDPGRIVPLEKISN